jgi:hypothetical protein
MVFAIETDQNPLIWRPCAGVVTSVVKINLIIAYWYSDAFSIGETYILIGIIHHIRGFSYGDDGQIS